MHDQYAYDDENMNFAIRDFGDDGWDYPTLGSGSTAYADTLIFPVQNLNQI